MAKVFILNAACVKGRGCVSGVKEKECSLASCVDNLKVIAQCVVARVLLFVSIVKVVERSLVEVAMVMAIVFVAIARARVPRFVPHALVMVSILTTDMKSNAIVVAEQGQ